jgi:hypothetical protein
MLEEVLKFLRENGESSKEQAQEFINKNYALEM